MTTIKLTSDAGGHKAGDTINVTPGVAAYLTGAGIAEDAKPARKAPAKPKADDTDG